MDQTNTTYVRTSKENMYIRTVECNNILYMFYIIILLNYCSLPYYKLQLCVSNTATYRQCDSYTCI